MSLKTLIIGGYGNFGSHIARALAANPDISVVIAGRSLEKARTLAEELHLQAVALDIDGDIEAAISKVAPDLVIHTTGPFQGQDYRVAHAAIAAGAHYADLSDARDFVAGIGVLDGAAKAQDVAVIAGSSSVPCLTAAFIDRYRPCFARLDRIEYGIGAAQATNRGLSTTAAILSYVGQPFTRTESGAPVRTHGWQGLTAIRYPELGLRLFGDCDIPDLALFPDRYPKVQSIRFQAGHELPPLHLGAWLMSWLVRSGLVRSLSPHAAMLHRMTLWFDRFGSGKSGFHMFLDGLNADGRDQRISIFIVARQAHGPIIPCLPAILLAERMATGWRSEPGARPCLDLFNLHELVAAMAGFDISVSVEGPGLSEHWGPPLN